MAEDESGSIESFRKITPETISFRQVARIADWTDQPPWMIGFEKSICSRRFPILVAPNRQYAQLLCDALNDRYSNQLMLPRFGWLPESNFPGHERVNLRTTLRQALTGKLRGDASADLHAIAKEAETVGEVVVVLAGPEIVTSDAAQHGQFFVFVRLFPGLRTLSPWNDWVVLPDQDVESAMLSDARKWAKDNWDKVVAVIQKQSKLRMVTPLQREDEESEAVEQLLADIRANQQVMHSRVTPAGENAQMKGSELPDQFETLLETVKQRMGWLPENTESEAELKGRKDPEESIKPASENNPDDSEFITESDPDAQLYQDRGKWCDGKFAKERYGIPPQRMTEARSRKGLHDVQLRWRKLKRQKGSPIFVHHRQDLETLSNAIDIAKDSNK